MRRSTIALAALMVWGCEAGPKPEPRYLLGAGYQVGGQWYYPRESYGLNETGLATVASRRSGLTANGEAYDPDAMAAGHQTLQLPAIARVTNLATGAQILVRINDRGPARPHRMLELTPRTASLLGISLLGVPAAGGTPIRLEVLEVESRQAVEGLRGAPKLQIATAPRESVRAEALSGPQAGPVTQGKQAQDEEVRPAAIIRLPETVTRGAAGPTTLWIRLGTFGRQEFAARQRARVAQLAPDLETSRSGGQTTYRLRIGPLTSVTQADATLDQVLRAGINDAHIVVE